MKVVRIVIAAAMLFGTVPSEALANSAGSTANASANSAGSTSYVAVEAHGSHGRVGFIRRGIERRQARRAHRRAARGSHGGTAHSGGSHGSSGGWVYVEAAPVVVSGGSAGSTAVAPACPNCVK